jgi:hypothetical protein
MATKYIPFKARLVMGSPFELKVTDHEGKPQPDENKHHWFMAFAVPKGPEWDKLWSTMYNDAAGDPACTAALCGQAGFNWKTEDCDAPEDPKKLGTDSRPAGHMLIKFTRYKSMGPVTLIDGNKQPIINKNAVKKGDYFWIAASTKFNGAATVKTNAGMYQNIEGMMFAEAGVEIVSEGAFNAETEFAGIQGGVVVNGGTSQEGAPVAAKPPVATTPPPTVPPASTAVTPPPPAHDLVTPPPVVAVQKYEYNGTVLTKPEWLAMPGWTEAMVDQHCKLVA